MKEITTVVVPIDFSETTNKLVRYALYMADKLQASVHFVHVVPPFPADTMIGAPFAVKCQEQLTTNARERMANLLEDSCEYAHGCTGEVVDGDPTDKITAQAKKHDADLIIISTHGAKGLEKIMLGSVAERVLKRAHCPVCIMNPYKE